MNAYEYINKNGLEHGKAKLESCIKYSKEYGKDILPDGMRCSLAEFKQAIADFELINQTLPVEVMKAKSRVRNRLKNVRCESCGVTL